jgi:hypothetical protein
MLTCPATVHADPIDSLTLEAKVDARLLDRHARQMLRPTDQAAMWMLRIELAREDVERE